VPRAMAGRAHARLAAIASHLTAPSAATAAVTATAAAAMQSTSTATASPNTTVLITGASRGIGFGLTELYAKKGFRVIAAARTPATAAALTAVAKAHPNVTVVALDVADSKSVAALPAALAAAKVTSVDVLINNAGVVGSRSLAQHSADSFMTVYRTNVVGVWDVTQSLMPLLRASQAVGGPKVINISSTMGSIAGTNDGPWAGQAAAYRVSKAALNQLSAVQAGEYNRTKRRGESGGESGSSPALITVVALHPGWVQTDMGKASGSPPTTLLQSVTGIAKVIDAVKPNPKTQFLDFENHTLPW